MTATKQKKKLKEMKIKESQPCLNYERIKKEGVSEEWNKGTDWSAEVLDFATTS